MLPMSPAMPPIPPPRTSRGAVLAVVSAVVVAVVAAAVIVVTTSRTSIPGTADPIAPVASSAGRTTGGSTTADGTPRDRSAGPTPTTQPRTTPAGTAAPGTTAPGTTAPRTTAPGTTAPRTTAPRTTPTRITPTRTESGPDSGPTAEPTPPPPSGPPAGGGAPRKLYAPADNPLLQDPRAGLQNRVCTLPAWSSSPAAAERFFRAEAACLDAAWGPLLEHYDMPFAPPKLHFPQRTSFDTPCGAMDVGIALAAYYCENNLYVPFGGLQTELYGNDPGVYLAVFAHEYGHHVQEVSGLMDASWKKIRAYGASTQKGRDMARRKELQAQCFSGMFLGAHVERGGSITRVMYDSAWNDQETRGDDTSGTHDHGSNAHFAQWWRIGAADNRIAQCNTFTAPAADVS